MKPEICNFDEYKDECYKNRAPGKTAIYLISLSDDKFKIKIRKTNTGVYFEEYGKEPMNIKIVYIDYFRKLLSNKKIKRIISKINKRCDKLKIVYDKKNIYYSNAKNLIQIIQKICIKKNKLTNVSERNPMLIENIINKEENIEDEQLDFTDSEIYETKKIEYQPMQKTGKSLLIHLNFNQDLGDYFCRKNNPTLKVVLFKKFLNEENQVLKNLPCENDTDNADKFVTYHIVLAKPNETDGNLYEEIFCREPVGPGHKIFTDYINVEIEPNMEPKFLIDFKRECETNKIFRLEHSIRYQDKFIIDKILIFCDYWSKKYTEVEWVEDDSKFKKRKFSSIDN